MSPDSSSPDISSTTEQFPACLWFGVCSLQWLVAYGQASVDPELSARENHRLYTFAAFSSRVVAESSRTAILLPSSAPSRRTCTRTHNRQESLLPSSANFCSSERRSHRSSLTSFSKCDSWAERTSANADSSRSHETARTPASPPDAWVRNGQLLDNFNTECDQPTSQDLVLERSWRLTYSLSVFVYKCPQPSIELFLCHGCPGLFPGRKNFSRVTFSHGFQGTHDGLNLGFKLSDAS